MIQGVVFDFGGVMTTSTMPQRVIALAKELGIPWEMILRGFSKYRHQYDGGFMTLEELYRATWKDEGLEIEPSVLSRFEEADTASWLYRNERTLAWMTALKAEGLKIGILTNMAPDFGRIHFCKSFADFIALSDAMVISGDEKLFKPQPEIYNLLQKRIALQPEELCFIDDIQENIDGAKACGWNAIRFVSNEQVAADLAQLRSVLAKKA